MSLCKSHVRLACGTIPNMQDSFHQPLRQPPHAGAGGFTAGKQELVEGGVQRLRRTAVATSPSTVRGAVGDVKRRCARLLAAGGGNIEEGGSGKE